MPLQSDLSIDARKFSPDSISSQTRQFNEQLTATTQKGPQWFEVGAAEYRRMRWAGETPIPAPTVLSAGINSSIASREAGRAIPIRRFEPEAGAGSARGVFMHVHGGGWVLQTEASQDLMLARYARDARLTVVSVGYRLAPEHPYPQGNEDCFDAAEYLVDHAQEAFGSKLLFIGGDSAGAHLSALTVFHLRHARPEFAFRGAVLNFGAYDVAGFAPQVYHFDIPLVMYLEIMRKYVDAYLPGTTEADRRDPWISPMFMNLTKLQLPPALFSCGTLDPLLDDSVFMSTKWAMSGAESILKIYPGAPHGFTFFPVGGTEMTEENLTDIATFMNERI